MIRFILQVLSSRDHRETSVRHCCGEGYSSAHPKPVPGAQQQVWLWRGRRQREDWGGGRGNFPRPIMLGFLAV